MPAQTKTAGQLVLSASCDLQGAGGSVDLLRQWNDGDVLRVVEEGENDFDAHHWLVIKNSLTCPTEIESQRYLLRVLATRRGFEPLGYGHRQDMFWAVIPRTIQLGHPFTIYNGRDPRWPKETYPIEVVKSAYIDW